MAGESAVVAAAVSEGVDRKRRTEERLAKRKIAVPAELPRIVSSKEVKLRDVEAIARRVMVLCLVAARAESVQLPVVEILKLLAQRGLAKDLSSSEQVFLGTRDPDEKMRQQYLWRYEGAWTLMWAMGYVDELSDGGKPGEVKKLVEMVVPKSLVGLMEGAKVRSVGEILDATDYAYRLHWAARDYIEKNNRPLDGLMVRVLFEQHYALNWLIGRAEWDGPIV